MLVNANHSTDALIHQRNAEPGADKPSVGELLPANVAPLARIVSLASLNELQAIAGVSTETKALLVVSPETAQQMSAHLNQLTRMESLVDERRLAAARPHRDEIKQIDGLAVPLNAELAPAIVHAKKELKAWREAEEAERQRVLAEQRRQAAEAERMRLALEAEAKRKADEARIAAETATREAERLKWEAEEKERQAAVQLTEGPRTDASFDEGAAKLAEAGRADEAAAKALLDAQALQAEALRLAEEAKRTPAPVAAPVVEVVAPVALKGTRTTKKVKFLTPPDPAKLPRIYLVADEAKLKKAILMGLVPKDTPGVEYVIEEEIGGSGR